MFYTVKVQYPLNVILTKHSDLLLEVGHDTRTCFCC